MYSRVIVKEEDLLPVSLNDGTYVCDEYVYYGETDPEILRRRGLRLISISEDMKKRAADNEKRLHEEWIIEKILPLARIMYNKQQGSNISVEAWKEFYFDKDPSTQRWITTAEAVYKYLHPEDADK